MSICDQGLDLCSAVLHTRTMTKAATTVAAVVEVVRAKQGYLVYAMDGAKVLGISSRAFAKLARQSALLDEETGSFGSPRFAAKMPVAQ